MGGVFQLHFGNQSFFQRKSLNEKGKIAPLVGTNFAFCLSLLPSKDLGFATRNHFRCAFIGDASKQQLLQRRQSNMLIGLCQ
jgi:hypothetical protein